MSRGNTAVSSCMGFFFFFFCVYFSLCFFFFFKQKTAYEIGVRLVGSEMCIRDSALPACSAKTLAFGSCVIPRKTSPDANCCVGTIRLDG